MTEDQAKTKWCPMVRTGLNAGMAVNHHVGGDVGVETRCIGAGCMMWRWFNSLAPDLAHHGYCGLAGREGALR